MSMRCVGCGRTDPVRLVACTPYPRTGEQEIVPVCPWCERNATYWTRQARDAQNRKDRRDAA